MKLEFKPEDFELDKDRIKEINMNALWAAQCANAKLEKYIKEHGKIIYGYSSRSGLLVLDTNLGKADTHQAILINIEPIKKCEHTREKIGATWNDRDILPNYQCTCGAKVRPTSFEEV